MDAFTISLFVILGVIGVCYIPPIIYCTCKELGCFRKNKVMPDKGSEDPVIVINPYNQRQEKCEDPTV